MYYYAYEQYVTDVISIPPFACNEFFDLTIIDILFKCYIIQKYKIIKIKRRKAITLKLLNIEYEVHNELTICFRMLLYILLNACFFVRILEFFYKINVTV